MVLLSIDPDGEVDPFHTHTVWCGGRPAGIVTTGAPGHRTGTVLALAYMRPESAQGGAPDGGDALEVSLLGRRRRARVLDTPPWDPGNARLRGGPKHPGSAAPPPATPTFTGPKTT